jgi:RNA polymerase sigma-70 factor (ECF subfamily)
MWEGSLLTTMVFSDEQLIERYLGGDTGVFNDLVRKWEKRIFNFVLRYCGTREEAQDLSQEIFTLVFRRLESLRDRKRFAPWLYRIALNQCRMRHRAEKIRQKVSLDAPEGVESLEKSDGLDSGWGVSNPEETLVRDEKVMHLRAALARISEDQRVVILLKEYEGLKFHEIAEILDCPLSTVKSRLYLGFRSLRAMLEERGIAG